MITCTYTNTCTYINTCTHVPTQTHVPTLTHLHMYLTHVHSHTHSHTDESTNVMVIIHQMDSIPVLIFCRHSQSRVGSSWHFVKVDFADGFTLNAGGRGKGPPDLLLTGASLHSIVCKPAARCSSIPPHSHLISTPFPPTPTPPRQSSSHQYVHLGGELNFQRPENSYVRRQTNAVETAAAI